MCLFFFFKQKTAYEMRISDWSSDVCSSDLPEDIEREAFGGVSLAQPRRQRDRTLRGGQHVGGSNRGVVAAERGLAGGPRGMRLSIERIDVGCLGEHVVGDAQAALVAAAQVERAAEQIELVGLDAGSRALGESLQLTRQPVQPKRLGNLAR